MSLGSLVPPSSRRRAIRSLLAITILGLGACADSGDSVVGAIPGGGAGASGNLTVLYECTVDVSSGTQSCQTPRPSGAASLDVIVGKPYVGFTTTGTVSSRGDASNEDTTSLNVALTNLMPQPIGTVDGVNAAPGGSRIFFQSGPTVTSVKVGTKTTETARVDNPSGIGNFTNPEGTYVRTAVPYYQYDGVLATNASSAPVGWRFVFSANTKTFTYSILVSVPIQYEFGWISIAQGTVTGAERQMLATAYSPVGTVLTESVTWSSSNSSVVTINASTGVMTDVGPGYATITATSTVNPQRKGTLAVVGASGTLPAGVLFVYDCHATTAGGGTLSCGNASPDPYLALPDSGAEVVGNVLRFNLKVQSMVPEAIGTPDGSLVDAAGVTVFVASATAGFAAADNADGSEALPNTAVVRPFFRYGQMLSQYEVTPWKEYELSFAPGTTEFRFQLHVVADFRPLLVINEVMVNPIGPTISDADLEWFEVYNAGRMPVQMQHMVVADSSAAGRRAYHLIASPLLVQSGGYVVLGNNTNTSVNGGAPVDYAYGVAMSFNNQLRALKLSKVYQSDTLTLDRTQYAQSAVSAKSGVSRELKNPALDNSNMDGSNWDDASVTSVYGTGGRGTPRAQNSTYTP